MSTADTNPVNKQSAKRIADRYFKPNCIDHDLVAG